MQEEENIIAYFQWVKEVVNTKWCLGETIDETLVVQKILRTLPARFNPKVSVVEEKDNLDTLNLSQLHGIVIAYEIRSDDPKQKEAAFKATKKKHQNIEKHAVVHQNWMSQKMRWKILSTSFQEEQEGTKVSCH